MVDKHYALAREAILEALTSYSGATTADGATPGNNTLIDSNLIGKNDFLSGKAILIGSGVDAAWEDKGVDSFDNLTGEITVSAGFSAQIKKGTPFRVLNVSPGGLVTALLNAVKAKTDTLPATPANEATSLLIKAKTDTLPATPANEATSLLIKAKTDNLPATPADEATVNAVGAVATAIQTALGRKYSFMDFWSAPEDKLTITNTPGDITFPDIVVSGLPLGATLKRVVLIMTCRAIEEDSAAANYINAASKTLRIMKDTGAWGTNDVVGITFSNASLYCAASSKEAGPVIIGAHDVKAEVDGDATYEVQSNQTNRTDAIVVLAASMYLYDVQVGVRIFFE